MKSLYIVSNTPYSGKFVVSLGLVSRLIYDGWEVGYVKPIGNMPIKVKNKETDEEAYYLNRSLGLNEPLEVISPIVLSEKLRQDIFKGTKELDFPKILKEAFAKASKGKNVMVIDGTDTATDGKLFGLSTLDVVKKFKPKVLMVTHFREDWVVDHILMAKEFYGENFIGVVFNNVGKEQKERLQKVIIPFLKTHEINSLGIILEDKTLQSISVAEVVSFLDGKILTANSHLDDLIEHFTIGAMNVDSALKYFRLSLNKAVITGGDRADIQLAALETSTKCLILTGNLYPSSMILTKAEEMGVPVILVKHSTLEATELINKAMAKLKIRDERKLRRAQRIVNHDLDFNLLYKQLNLTKG